MSLWPMNMLPEGLTAASGLTAWRLKAKESEFVGYLLATVERHVERFVSVSRPSADEWARASLLEQDLMVEHSRRARASQNADLALLLGADEGKVADYLERSGQIEVSRALDDKAAAEGSEIPGIEAI